MAATTGKHVIYNASITINAVDLSTRVKSVTYVVGINSHPGAAMQEAQDYSISGTRLVEPIKVQFFNDYNTSQVYQTHQALWLAMTTFTIIVKPDSGADGATNPAWNIAVFIKQQPFLDVSRGDPNLAALVYEPAGLMTFDTTP